MARSKLTNVQDVLTAYAAGRRDFQEIRISRPDFSKKIRQSIDLSGADFSGADLQNADFVGVTLVGSKFRSAILNNANFARADARNADFRYAQCGWSNFNLADLSGAHLTFAQIYSSQLRETDLFKTVLSGADLRSSNIQNSNTEMAQISRIKLQDTILSGVDLRPFFRAKLIGTTSFVIDWKSIALSAVSERTQLKPFLMKSGMPALVAEYMIDCAQALDRFELRSLMQSTFISYGAPDQQFAATIRDKLHQNGVTTFFFRDDAPAGEKIRRVMHEKIQSHDRVILVCSRASLDRKSVLVEIEETLDRESRDGGASYLIPITLDDYVFQDWSPSNCEVRDAIRDRVVADFRGTQEHTGKLDRAVMRLLQVLKKKPIVLESIISKLPSSHENVQQFIIKNG